MAKHLVARAVAETFVNLLEAIQIQGQNGKTAFRLPGGPAQGHAQPVAKQRPVGQPGQMIVKGLIRQLFLGNLPAGNIFNKGFVILGPPSRPGHAARAHARPDRGPVTAGHLKLIADDMLLSLQFIHQGLARFRGQTEVKGNIPGAPHQLVHRVVTQYFRKGPVGQKQAPVGRPLEEPLHGVVNDVAVARFRPAQGLGDRAALGVEHAQLRVGPYQFRDLRVQLPLATPFFAVRGTSGRTARRQLHRPFDEADGQTPTPDRRAQHHKAVPLRACGLFQPYIRNRAFISSRDGIEKGFRIAAAQPALPSKGLGERHPQGRDAQPENPIHALIAQQDCSRLIQSQDSFVQVGGGSGQPSGHINH